MRISWYVGLDRTQRHTYGACLGLIALDSMASTAFSLVVPTFIVVLGVTHSQIGLLGSTYLIGTAIGGWGAGIVADRIGRVKMFQITILAVAFFTLALAFTNDFRQIVLIRTLQGIAYGGEATIAGVMISEAVSETVRGRAAGSIQSGYALGYAISVLAMPAVFYLAPEQFAWRIMFGLGVLPIFFVLYMRRGLSESVVFSAEQKTRLPGARGFRANFRRPLLAKTVIGTIFTAGVLDGAYVMITWLPSYLRLSLGMAVSTSTPYLIANILGSFVGPLAYGPLSDKIGRKKSFIAFLLAQSINVSLFLFLSPSGSLTYLLAFVLGALQGGLASGLAPCFSEIFPTSSRASGVGFCMSIGRGLGAVVPALVGTFADHFGLGMVMGICAISSYVVAIVTVLVLHDSGSGRLDVPLSQKEMMSSGRSRESISSSTNRATASRAIGCVRPVQSARNWHRAP